LSGLQISADAAVSVVLVNTGRVAGTTMPQLYLEFPGEAGQNAPVLKGFQKVLIAPGATSEVTFVLTEQDRSFWSTEAGGWRLAAGGLTAHVGDSAADIKFRVPLDAPVIVV
jgi:beta-glucosidase